ncbi:thermonuclease NucI [Staphylococcus kloosii]|uniref:thermonuclease NucI n=1 Tax=Staphylococcus kloosii TaxID=29384 RepID=UPI0028A47338|nr:thermonuclease family protein [Staphylococcus kloosii]MDT3959686.1 thermonuclease family protein [Staphylococcus kloosii]
MKSSKQVTILICCVVVIGVLFFQFINHSGPFANNDNNTLEKGLDKTSRVHVERVVDGDTFVAKDKDNNELKVRLIGMDTPETVKPNTPVQPYGKAASNFTKEHLTNKDVYLEYDKEPKDRYGRTLAYVWLDKKTMFNEVLVQKGLAREKYFAPNGKYRDVFKKAQADAQSKHLNIWSKKH